MGMNAQVSYVRILVGDNTAPYTYSDAQIKQAINAIGPTRPALPAALRICGNLGFRKYPAPG